MLRLEVSLLPRRLVEKEVMLSAVAAARYNKHRHLLQLAEVPG